MLAALLVADAAASTPGLGLSVALGEGHSFRFWKVLSVPRTSWRYEKQHVSDEAGTAAWLLVNEVHVRVGGQIGPLGKGER